MSDKYNVIDWINGTIGTQQAIDNVEQEEYEREYLEKHPDETKVPYYVKDDARRYSLIIRDLKVLRQLLSIERCSKH